MRLHLLLLLAVVLAGGAACRAKPSDARIYKLQGQILSIDASGRQATIKHEDIVGLMPAMTMPYKVKEAKLLSGLKPGDLINATLAVASDDAYLTEVRKVGDAPLEKPPAEAPAPASSGFELVKPGAPVPDAHFVDESGRKRTFSSFKGSRVALTFIYTSCPLPTFCPMMDRHFASIQKTIKSDPSLKDVHLISVSFDPIVDTPAVLKKHAHDLGADPARWTFLTGDRDEIDQFAAHLGLSVARAQNDQRDITHNLRTVVVDAKGTLVSVYPGNEWTPAMVLADLKK